MGSLLNLAKIRWFKIFIDRLKLARTYNGEDPIMEKPVYLKEIRGNLREDIGQVEAEVDSSIFLILRNDGRYIELGEAKKLAISRPSYHRMLDFSCCPLLRLLTVSGKIGDCECYKSGGLHWNTLKDFSTKVRVFIVFSCFIFFYLHFVDLEEFLLTLEAKKFACFETIEILLLSWRGLNILQTEMRWLEWSTSGSGGVLHDKNRGSIYILDSFFEKNRWASSDFASYLKLGFTPVLQRE